MSAQILLAHRLIEIPAASGEDCASRSDLGTVLANLAYYGFTLSISALTAVRQLSAEQLEEFWRALEPELIHHTGADREIGEWVVYKNFPHEVLAMSEAEYWVRQFFIYAGLPYDAVAQEEQPRPNLQDKLTLAVLSQAKPGALPSLYKSLVSATSSWTSVQLEHAVYLSKALAVEAFNLADFGYKANGLTLIYARSEVPAVIADATDVLRLGAAMSYADVTLRTKFVFRKFTRAERRKLLALLEASKNLEADMAERKELFKRFLSLLHPGDFKVPRVVAAYDKLYKRQLTSEASRREALRQEASPELLATYVKRPGEFLRQLHALYGVYGSAAVDAFLPIAPSLETDQLLKLQAYLRTVQDRKQFVSAPRGAWTKAQLRDNTKKPFTSDDHGRLMQALAAILAARITEAVPEGIAPGKNLDWVKLVSNGQELAAYGRGSKFRVPDNVTFLRTASYWSIPEAVSNDFMDNSWQFFDANWTGLGAVCWNATNFQDGAAVFSGDATIANVEGHKAAQLVDLDIEKLLAAGVRYAVWSILSFNHVPFNSVEEVAGALQWGTDANSGELFEPSRVQMFFNLRSKNLTSYVAYVDLQTREVVYMDLPLSSSLRSAQDSLARVGSVMPAIVEHLASLPSLADVVAGAPAGVVPVLYSDAETALPEGSKAYVFRPENPQNSFEQVPLTELMKR